MIDYLKGRLEGRRDGISVKIRFAHATGTKQFHDVTLLAADAAGAVYVENNSTVCRPWADISSIILSDTN